MSLLNGFPSRSNRNLQPSHGLQEAELRTVEPDYDGKGVHEPNSARTSSHDMAGTSGEGVRGGADGSGASGPGSAASPVPGDAAGEKPTPQVLPHDGDATHDDEDVLECHEDELVSSALPCRAPNHLGPSPAPQASHP